ncbi:hypothetical protein B4096_1679 [Heyndrickxia coagulans]|nr:hypothetical protein B4096_1679 [Heyndrickxia coagulans]
MPENQLLHRTPVFYCLLHHSQFPRQIIAPQVSCCKKKIKKAFYIPA